MLTTQVEPFSQIKTELQSLLMVHWQSIALNRDKVKLNPRYEKYYGGEAQGTLSILTLRHSGKLVGYWVMFVDAELHYADCLASQMDIFFIHEDYRDGPAALILMRAVEQECRRRGCLRWYAGEKLHSPIGRLFKAFGFAPIETHWMKWLGP